MKVLGIARKNRARILIAFLVALFLLPLAPVYAQDFQPPSGSPPPERNDTSDHNQLSEDYAPYLGQRYKKTVDNIENLFTTFMRVRYRRGEPYTLAWAFINNVLTRLGNKPENQNDDFNGRARIFLEQALSLNTRNFFPRITEHPWLKGLVNNARDIGVFFLALGFSLIALYWIASLGFANFSWRADAMRSLIFAVIIAFVVINSTRIIDFVQDAAYGISNQLCQTIMPHLSICTPAARLHHAIFHLDPESQVGIRIANGILAYSFLLIIAIFRLAQEVAIAAILIFSIPAVAALAIPIFGENITQVWVRMYARYLISILLLIALYLLFSILLSKLIQAAPAFGGWRDLLKFLYWMLAGGFTFSYTYIAYDFLLKPVIKETISAAPIIIEGISNAVDSAVNAFSSGMEALSGAAKPPRPASPSLPTPATTDTPSTATVVEETIQLIETETINRNRSTKNILATTSASASASTSTPAQTDALPSPEQAASFFNTPARQLTAILQYQPTPSSFWLASWLSAIDAVNGNVSKIGRETNEPFINSAISALYYYNLETQAQTLKATKKVLNGQSNKQNLDSMANTSEAKASPSFSSTDIMSAVSQAWQRQLLAALLVQTEKSNASNKTPVSVNTQNTPQSPETLINATLGAPLSSQAASSTTADTSSILALIQNAPREAISHALASATLAQKGMLADDFAKWGSIILTKTINNPQWTSGIPLLIESSQDNPVPNPLHDAEKTLLLGNQSVTELLQAGKWQTLAGSIIAQQILKQFPNLTEEQFRNVERVSVISASLLKQSLPVNLLQETLTQQTDSFWKAGQALALSLLRHDSEHTLLQPHNFLTSSIAYLLLYNAQHPMLHLNHQNDEKYPVKHLINSIAEQKEEELISMLLANSSKSDPISETQQQIIAAMLTTSLNLPYTSYKHVLAEVKNKLDITDLEWFRYQLKHQTSSQDLANAIRTRYQSLLEHIAADSQKTQSGTLVPLKANTSNSVNQTQMDDPALRMLLTVITSTAIAASRTKNTVIQHNNSSPAHRRRSKAQSFMRIKSDVFDSKTQSTAPTATA
ncbi:MAG: hypothetical protein QXO09_05570 [Candidatus Caldarchaeum sp.]